MKSHTLIGGTMAGLVLLLGLLLFGIQNTTNVPLSGAGDGLVANPRIATTTVLGPQGASVVKNQLFAANALCTSRVITTPGTSAIVISFDDIPSAGNIGSTTVGAGVGHLQAASTSVAYDAEIYGCGVWNGWAWASTTVSLTENQ